MKQIIISLILIVIAHTASFAEDCFPGKTVSYSPKKRYSIVWSEPTDNETHHLLFYNGKEKKDFFEFVRSACVIWEPSGEYFALTYHMGSNVSEAYIYSSKGPKKVFDILDFVPADTKKLFTNNFHSYLEVSAWTNTGLMAHMWGYGDTSPEGFDVTLKCIKKENRFNCTKEKNNRVATGLSPPAPTTPGKGTIGKE
jgi:hypothetical protein